MNVIARMEFELAYYDVVAEYINHITTDYDFKFWNFTVLYVLAK